MKCKQVAPWLSAYADGELDAERYAAVAAHLDACAQCRCEVECLRNLGAALWETLGPEGGAPDVSTVVARRVHRQRQWDFGVRAAAAILVCGLGVFALAWRPAPDPAPSLPRVNTVSTPLTTTELVRTSDTALRIAQTKRKVAVRLTVGGRADRKRPVFRRPSRPLLVARRQTRQPLPAPDHVAQRVPLKAPTVQATPEVVVVSVPPAYYPLEDRTVEYVLRRDASPPAATSVATGSVPGVVE